MKIGILQTGHAPDQIAPQTGDYDDMFRALLSGNGFDFATYPVVDGIFPPDGATACDGWLITGSRHGAYEDHPWIAPLEDLIRSIAASGRPLVGVCFGHQIIAQALGGQVEKFPGGWAIGRTEYDLLGAPTALNAWHQDQVTQLPPGAQVIGTNAFCENAALVIGDNVLTIQPHPEFTSAVVDGLIRHRGRGNLPDDLLDRAETALPDATDSPLFAALMADFFNGTPPKVQNS